MKLFDKIFKKNKNCYKLNQSQENNLVVMLIPKKQIKLNEKIIVPEGFCSIVLSKEKLLDIIPSGEYELTGLTIPKTCKINKMDKPTKKGFKNKFYGDFYFVNFHICKISNQFYIKKLNLNINFSLTFQIDSPIKFVNFLINEKIVFDNSFANKFLNFKLSQTIYYYFLDNKFIESVKLKDFVINKLNTIGIKSIDFEICYNKEKEINEEPKMEDNKEIEQQQEISDYNIENDLSSSLNNKYNSLVSLDDITSENISYFVCECGAKLPKASKVCYNCKKSYEEKNCCEYCGEVIEKGVFVCPHCKSVLIGN